MASPGLSEAERWKAEAERWREVAEEQAAELSELRAQVAALTERLATVTKLVFGRSSEKCQASTAAVTEPGPPEGADPGSPKVTEVQGRRGQRPGSKGHGRRDYSHLVTEEQVHDVPEAKRVCPNCQAAYAPFGEETSDQVDWRVVLVRIVHRRPTYRRMCQCRVRGVLVAPPPPKVVPKGLFTAMFCARLLTEKYVLGRPLERIVGALGHDGLEVSKGTLVGVIDRCSALIAPLDAAIRERNGLAGHLHIDETSWSVFAAVGDKANHRFWLWAFVGADTTVFSIEMTRSTEVLRRHLGIDVEAEALEGDRRLLVSSDFYAAYQSIATVEGVDPLYCWAHIRRYFLRAAAAFKNLESWTAKWLELIGALYATHQALAGLVPGSDEHARAKDAFESALARIDTTRKREMLDQGLHWKCYEVLATLDHEWDGLKRHAEFPELPLDNNAAEVRHEVARYEWTRRKEGRLMSVT